MESDNSRIRKEVSSSPLTVSRVYTSDYQKEGTLTAELKQTITTKSFYPSKSVANSLQDNIFSMSDFGFEETAYENKETRVAWIDVPVGSTQESVQQIIDGMNDARLYRVLQNHPILADTDDLAIANPEIPVTKDMYANKQAVRFSDNSDNAGELALDKNGKIQYRKVFFTKQAKEDQDWRTDDEHFYASPELAAELNNVAIESQSL